MAGTQTHGFDMVMEISTQTIQNILSGIFDNDGFLAGIFPAVLPLTGFSLNVGFNRPSDVPAAAVNPVELLLELTFSGGITGQLRLVVGMDTDRSDADTDWVFLDFENKLYISELTLNGFTVPGAGTFVENKLHEHPIKLIPIPVQRGSANPIHITRADVKIIDDVTAANADAIAIVLTFGGGAAGNLNAFTSAFARAGAGAAVAINFDWICRNMQGRVEDAIGLPDGSFAGCSFNGDHSIRDGVRLTRLTISPVADSIRLSGTVRKSGTCYSASGTFGANIFVAVEAGELRVRFNIEDPDIDVSIPWYCWLAGAVIGAILGAVIAGIVGAIVGGIIVPLVIWIAQSVVEATVENIAHEILEAIGGVDLNVPLVGIDQVLDRAFIDDLTVTYDLYPQEYAEIKSQGRLTVRSGDFLDLDNGFVKATGFSGADIKMIGSLQSRKLKALCGTSFARQNSAAFSRLRRYHQYLPQFGLFDEILFDEVVTYINLGFLPDIYIPKFRVWSAITSDGCYSFFQVVNVTEHTYEVLYKTYQLESFTVRIKGDFRCSPAFAKLNEVKQLGVEYVAAATINKQFTQILRKAEEPKLKLQSQQLMMKMEKMPVSVDEPAEMRAKLLDYNRAAGKWIGKYVQVRKKKSALFRATIDGKATITAYNWMVDGKPLKQGTEGKITVHGVTFDYKLDGSQLLLSSSSSKSTELAIKVTVVTELGSTQSVIRCVQYKNDCKFEKVVIPAFSEFLERFDIEYGVVKIPPVQLMAMPDLD